MNINSFRTTGSGGKKKNSRGRLFHIYCLKNNGISLPYPILNKEDAGGTGVPPVQNMTSLSNGEDYQRAVRALQAIRNLG
jgi:hypothetical protein